MIYDNSNSPLMKTPYLDASTSNDTPFIDAISPPFIDAAIDFNQNYYVPLNKKPNDICIASYLTNYDIAKLAHDPVAVFNGDPNLLIIDKSKTPLAPQKASPTVKLETVDEESRSDNTLFPPLKQQEIKQEPQEDTKIDMNRIKSEGLSLDELLGFDATSPLTEMDDYEEQQFEEEQQEKEEERETKQKKKNEQHEKKTTTNSKKRKANASVTDSNNAAVKKPRNAKDTNKEAKLYQCPLCDHKSKRRYNLSTHIKTHDKNRVKEFECSLCSKSFDRRHDRDRHLATVHRKERTHGCPHCINQFSRNDALNRHLVQKHGYDEADLED